MNTQFPILVNLLSMVLTVPVLVIPGKGFSLNTLVD